MASAPTIRAERLEPRVLYAATVVARQVFYNNSGFDGRNVAVNAQDDAAIAADKAALLPGQTATFANYTSYDKGLNGIAIDLAGLEATPDVSDFQFVAGNTTDPSTWAAAPAPSAIVRRAGAGVGGSDRVSITWPDGAIKKQWIRVAMLPSSYTGLATLDVFYFGNAIGESGDNPSNAFVDAVDIAGARDNPRGFANPAPATFRWDYNRDRLVDTLDLAVARDNPTGFATSLRLFTAPVAPTLQSSSIGVDFTSNRNAGGQAVMSAGEVAGAPGVAQANWTSAPVPTANATSGTLASLKNQAGAATTATLTYNSPNNYSNQYNESLSGNFHMMDGYLDPDGTGPAVASFTSLPFVGTYDVYVYADGENQWNYRVGDYVISGASKGNAAVAKGDPIQNNNDDGPTFVFDEASDFYTTLPSGGQPGDRQPMKPVGGGNYILFKGVSGASFTLTVTANAATTTALGGDVPRAAINGIQIVGRTAAGFTARPSGVPNATAPQPPPANPPTSTVATGRMIAVDPLATRLGVDGQGALPSGSVAGAPGVRQPWWNPLPVVGDNFGNHTSYSNLRDNAGALTTLRINQFVDTNFDVGFNENLSADHKMMDGYFDTAAIFGQIPTAMAFVDVPYALYDVYVYGDGDGAASQGPRIGVYSLTTTQSSMPTAKSVRKFDPPDTRNAQNATSTFVYDDASIDGVGNYVVFRNVVGPRFTVTTTPVDSHNADGSFGGNPRGPINGVQIVEVTAAAAAAARGDSVTARSTSLPSVMSGPTVPVSRLTPDHAKMQRSIGRAADVLT
jgi:hypothetical protein